MTTINTNIEAPLRFNERTLRRFLALNAEGTAMKRKQRPKSVSERQHLANRIMGSITHIDENGCWISNLALSGPCDKYGRGYPSMRVRGRLQRLNRLSWTIHHDRTVPKGAVVRHTCNNPSCVSPLHLRSGSQGENMRDMVSAGHNKRRRGEAHGQSKITDAQVNEVRSHLRDGVLTGRAISARYGVSESLISQIRRGIIRALPARSDAEWEACNA